MTAAPPATHGLTGWHVYLDEIDAVGAVLPFRVRGTEEPLSRRGLQPAALMSQPPFVDRLPPAVACHVISPARIADSEFNVAHAGRAQRHRYTSLAQFFQAIEFSVRKRDDPVYVYAYWPELDSIAHEYGVSSRQALESLRRFDKGFARLLTALAGSDTTLVVTGDHGLIDAAPEQAVELSAHPVLASTLLRPLCGERRAAYCYVREDCRSRFEAYVRNELADRTAVYDSATLVRQGWFGDPPHHPRLAARTGDYVLLMRDRATIKDWLPGEKHYRQIGVHGGTSADEMLVPLVVAHT
jgi:predicted AlkP superfamily pyrophosphatase or phosphodiesterase